MRRILCIIGLVLLCTFADAEDGLMERIIEVNSPENLQADWIQTRHSPLLVENLESRGTVTITDSVNLRWEVISPVHSVTEFGAENNQSRFRMPSAKDFKASFNEDGTLVLVPTRRDLRQMFRRITLTLDPSSLIVKTVLLEGNDESWTKIDFKNIKTK